MLLFHFHIFVLLKKRLVQLPLNFDSFPSLLEEMNTYYCTSTFSTSPLVISFSWHIPYPWFLYSWQICSWLLPQSHIDLHWFAEFFYHVEQNCCMLNEYTKRVLVSGSSLFSNSTALKCIQHRWLIGNYLVVRLLVLLFQFYPTTCIYL